MSNIFGKIVYDTNMKAINFLRLDNTSEKNYGKSRNNKELKRNNFGAAGRIWKN